MDIAIIGTGNVGAALAMQWAKRGHHIHLGVRDTNHFKGRENLRHPNINASTVADAVKQAAVVIIATPATAAIDVAKSLGDTSGKIIIDTMNIVMGKGPEGFSNTSAAILANTATGDVVKCFNSTGFNNMENPVYHDMAIDMFVAGDSARAKAIAMELSADAGFAACYDIGGNDKFELLEQFALFWINLALFQQQGRNIAFKLLKR